jgi:P-type Cu+ transporter
MSSPSPAPTPPEFADQGSTVATAELAVTGMHCASCVALIQESLIERTGVISASVDLDSARAKVGYDPALVGLDDLQSTVEEAGYSATPVD